MNCCNDWELHSTKFRASAVKKDIRKRFWIIESYTTNTWAYLSLNALLADCLTISFIHIFLSVQLYADAAFAFLWLWFWFICGPIVNRTVMMINCDGECQLSPLAAISVQDPSPPAPQFPSPSPPLPSRHSLFPVIGFHFHLQPFIYLWARAGDSDPRTGHTRICINKLAVSRVATPRDAHPLPPRPYAQSAPETPSEYVEFLSMEWNVDYPVDLCNWRGNFNRLTNSKIVYIVYNKITRVPRQSHTHYTDNKGWLSITMEWHT